MSSSNSETKTAMVWGATGGIGSAIIVKLQEAGWNVAAILRDTEKIKSETQHIFKADVTDRTSIENIIEALGEVSDTFDLFIYAIGDITAEKVLDQSPESWDRIISANLTGAYLATHFSLPLLSKDAHLIFLGAITEKLDRVPRLAAYAASKGGLESFVGVLTREERKRKITLVRPSAVRTVFWEKVPFSVPSEASTPEQIADEVLNAYSTGHKGVLDL